MKKRVVTALLAGVMAVSVLAGCSAKDSGTQGSTAAPESTQETETAGEVTITPDREITLVTAGSGEPYSLLADDGTWTGIDAEVWAEIEERTGWTVTLKQAAFDAIWGELDTQRADVCANCWAVKPERVEKYNDSIPYYGDAQCVIVKEDNTDINEFADLAGKKIGVTNGQAAQTIVEGMSEEIGFEIVLYEDSAVGMKDLSLGRLDAYANTTTNVNNYMHYNEGEVFRFLNEDLMANNVAYFFPKTEEGARLRDEVNIVLQELLDDGTIAGITEKWMYADMTKLIK